MDTLTILDSQVSFYPQIPPSRSQAQGKFPWPVNHSLLWQLRCLYSFYFVLGLLHGYFIYKRAKREKKIKDWVIQVQCKCAMKTLNLHDSWNWHVFSFSYCFLFFYLTFCYFIDELCCFKVSFVYSFLVFSWTFNSHYWPSTESFYILDFWIFKVNNTWGSSVKIFCHAKCCTFLEHNILHLVQRGVYLTRTYSRTLLTHTSTVFY